ncbi:MAG: type II secretion system F family protein [Patescibacteria group bacterium]
MASYKFTGTKEGKKISGNVDAPTKDVAMSTLSHQNVHVLSLRATSGGSIMSKLPIGKPKVKQKDLVIFTRQLSTMISAGVPLTRSLTTMQTQAENKYFGSIIGSISKDIEGGMALADSFEKHPDTFSDVYVNMVRAGESGGILDEILQRLAAQVEKDATIRKKVKSAMAYPVVILGVTVIAFFGIMIFVIPKLGKIIKDLGGPDAELPVYTQAMLGLSGFMQKNAILIFIVMFIGTFFFRRYIKTPKGKYKLHSTLLKIPVIKVILIKIAIARFARTFASLMAAGVGVLDALEVTGKAIGNLVIEEELKEAADQIKAGKQLSEPLSKSPHFPAIVAQMLAIGEETGQIDTILLKVADFYEEEVDAVIDGISSLIEPVMILVLGGMVGIIAASVMGPIASLSQNVGKE